MNKTTNKKVQTQHELVRLGFRLFIKLTEFEKKFNLV
jgi:hypothetical protein